MTDLELRLIELASAGSEPQHMIAPHGRCLGVDVESLLPPDHDRGSLRSIAEVLTSALYDHIPSPRDEEAAPTELWLPVVAGCFTFARTGEDLTRAIAAGFEAGTILVSALERGPRRSCWDRAAIAGGIAASIALSRLSGLSPEQATVALALATVQAPQYRAAPGRALRSFQLAQTTAASVEAVHVARAGITASPDPISGSRGLFEVLQLGDVPAPDPDASNRSLALLAYLFSADVGDRVSP